MLADDGKLFTKVDTVFQIADARVPCANLTQGRGRLQPLRQVLFTHSGADGTQKLEQPSFAEEVEVRSVNVARVVELSALLTIALPTVFDPRQALSIEISRPVGAGSRSACGLVGDHQCGECGDTQQEPAWREEMLGEGEPGCDQDEHRQGQAGCAEAGEGRVEGF